MDTKQHAELVKHIKNSFRAALLERGLKRGCREVKAALNKQSVLFCCTAHAAVGSAIHPEIEQVHLLCERKRVPVIETDGELLLEWAFPEAENKVKKNRKCAAVGVTSGDGKQTHDVQAVLDLVQEQTNTPQAVST